MSPWASARPLVLPLSPCLAAPLMTEPLLDTDTDTAPASPAAEVDAGVDAGVDADGGAAGHVAAVVAPASSRSTLAPLVVGLRARLRDRAMFALVTLGLVSAAAILQARGIGHVMAAELVAAPRVEVAAGSADDVGDSGAAVHRVALRKRVALGVAARGGDPLDWPAPTEGPIDLYAAPSCPDIELAGLAVFADPRASLATLRLPNTAPAAPVSVGQGERVLDGRVLFIGQDRVWIERPSPAPEPSVRVCQARLSPGPDGPR